MKRETRTEFEEWLKWFNWNRGCAMPLEQRVKFQDKAILGLFRLVCALYDELDDDARKRLLLPSGLRLLEPLRNDDA